jgi:adenosylhomocysteinase
MRTQTVGCDVKDMGLALAGEGLIEGAARELPVLMLVRERLERERPLEGLRVSACLPVTSETASLMATLKAGGADVVLCASDPLSTNDAVAAALAISHGVRTYAVSGEDGDTHRSHIATVLAHRPHLTMDGGGDLVAELHGNGGRLVDHVLGGTEGTARGVIRLKAMAAQGVLRYPVIAIGGAVMDVSFANHALSLAYLASGRPKLERNVHELPIEIDGEVARLRLCTAGKGT